MTERRVVITGMGVVTAGGLGVEALWSALSAGGSAIQKVSAFDASGFPCQVAGQLQDFSASQYVPKSYRKAVKVMARDIEIAVAAADLAVRDSGLTTAGIDPQKIDVEPGRLGCNIGAGLICADLDELGAAVNSAVRDGRFDLGAWGREGMANLTPLWLLKYLPNMLSCHVTIIHQAKGPSNCITCGEASAHLAVGEATRTIARGACDVAIAGGAESKLNPMGLLRQALLGRLNVAANDSPAQACRPFDAAAAGTVIGEGGGLLVLEEQSRAAARGARAYAEIAGFGAGCDPAGADYSHTAGGLPRAIGMALADAQVGPEHIDLVVAHGTGVPAEDAAEAAALRQALGERAATVPVLAVTWAVGNLYAGAGGVQTAVAAACLHRQTVLPTVNFATPASHSLPGMTRGVQPAALGHVLVASCGTGGQSAALVLKRTFA